MLSPYVAILQAEAQLHRLRRYTVMRACNPKCSDQTRSGDVLWSKVLCPQAQRLSDFGFGIGTQVGIKVWLFSCPEPALTSMSYHRCRIRGEI